LYALAGLLGMFCVIAGGRWLLFGPGPLMGAFPATLAEAVAGMAAGLVVLVWSIRKLQAALRPAIPERN